MNWEIYGPLFWFFGIYATCGILEMLLVMTGIIENQEVTDDQGY